MLLHRTSNNHLLLDSKNPSTPTKKTKKKTDTSPKSSKSKDKDKDKDKSKSKDKEKEKNKDTGKDSKGKDKSSGKHHTSDDSKSVSHSNSSLDLDDGGKSNPNTWQEIQGNGTRVGSVLACAHPSNVTTVVIAPYGSKLSSIPRFVQQDDDAFRSRLGGKRNVWLEWIASEGMLWVSTDCADGGYDDTDSWIVGLSRLMATLLSAKPLTGKRPGIVFVLLGAQAKLMKKVVCHANCSNPTNLPQIQKHHSDGMGIVKIKIVEGPSPVQDTFEGASIIEKIEDARGALGLGPLVSCDVGIMVICNQTRVAFTIYIYGGQQIQ